MLNTASHRLWRVWCHIVIVISCHEYMSLSSRAFLWLESMRWTVHCSSCCRRFPLSSLSIAVLLPVFPQLHDTCNDQASRSEVLEKELLQLQQQAEDAEQAVTDLEARYTAQMALWKRQYKAKVASLKDKQSSVMESYIKLQRMYNRELQAKQQSEVSDCTKPGTQSECGIPLSFMATCMQHSLCVPKQASATCFATVNCSRCQRGSAHE